jgi:hypothetical protein
MSPTEPNIYMADGRLIGLNYYDMQLYCFGKGPSAITAEAPMTAVKQGESMIIRGMVTDESVGAKEIASNAGFKNGVPAVSDESQSAWMEYIYMQQARPTNVKGVTIKLTAIDPNGNYQNIGTTISDDLGTYAIAWTPPVPGQYSIRATFEGSKSYYGSEASSSFVVQAATATPAPVPTATPTQTSPPITTPPTVAPSPTQAVLPPTSQTPTTTYFAIGGSIVIIIIAAAALVLRSRKTKKA